MRLRYSVKVNVKYNAEFQKFLSIVPMKDNKYITPQFMHTVKYYFQWFVKITQPITQRSYEKNDERGIRFVSSDMRFNFFSYLRHKSLPFMITFSTVLKIKTVNITKYFTHRNV